METLDPALFARAMRERADDRRDLALETLARVAVFAPNAPQLLQAIAHTRLEAGLPAVEAFLRAIAAAPSDPALRLGYAAARFAAGEGTEALDELGALMAGNPHWAEGHAAFARLASLTGHPERFLDTVTAVAEALPEHPVVRLTGIDIALNAQAHDVALRWAEQAARDIGASPAWTETCAICLDELGDRAAAAKAFAALGAPDSPERAVRYVRHLLRGGELSRARQIVDAFLGKPGDAGLWPYASTLWRIGDPVRAKWLHRAGALVRSVALGIDGDDLAALRTVLGSLHAQAGRFPDQSVRGGTQTDGALFARIEPEIMAVRARIAAAVADYRASLPPAEEGHPLLGAITEGPVGFSGSWSVRLTRAGFHAAHHHPLGWLSSAFYVTVPQGMEAGEGVLELGKPPADLGIALPPLSTIVPREGELALFPSWMWHGTTPFAAGERVTIAFDVTRT